MRRIVIALALVAAACGGSADPATSTTTAPATTSQATTTTFAAATTTVTTLATAASTTTTAMPVRPPGEVVIGLDMAPGTLNPLSPGGDTMPNSLINQALHVGLTEIDGETLEIVGDLAVEVPSVENGGVVLEPNGRMTVRWELHPEAVWADGTPITGADVAFTYEAIMGLAQEEAKQPYRAIVPGSANAEDHAVAFTFSAPTLAFDVMFPVIIPAHQVAGTDIAADWQEVPWLSGGPFAFVSWDTPGDIVLERNPRFWKKGSDGEPLPHFERVLFRFIPETSALIDAFVSGEVDLFSPPPFSETVDDLRGIDGVEVHVREGPIWEHFTFQFGENNRNPGTLNTDLDFRRAVAHLVDRHTIADLGFWEADEPLQGILGLHGLDVGLAPWSRYQADTAEADQLLSGLCDELSRDCAADPPVVVFSTTSNAYERPRIASLLQEMLGDAGIEVRLELEDSALFFGPSILAGDFDLGMWAWVALPGAAGILGTLSIWSPDNPPLSTAGANFGRWGTAAVSGEEPGRGGGDPNQGPSQVQDESTARYSEIIALMETTADIEEFMDLAAQAEEILADQVVIIPVLARNSVGAVWADRIEGFVHSPWEFTWNIEEWRLIP